jgi:hypothetical protein
MGSKTRAEMAERQGFEPWIPFRVYTLSKRAPSATQPSLRSGYAPHNGTATGGTFILSYAARFVPVRYLY